MNPISVKHLDDMIKRYPELEVLRDEVKRAASLICKCYESGGKILVCGNGGSAADSQHIVGELMKGFVLRREIPASDIDCLRKTGYHGWDDLANRLQQGVPAIALTEHTALSSAILNDTDPYMTFAQQVYVYGKPGDVVIGISTSGNATNVVNALKVAKAFNMFTIGMTGSRPSKMDDLCDVILKAPATETYKVQEYHLPIYHLICLIVEQELFGQDEMQNDNSNCA